MKKRLQRSSKQRVIGGVAGGIAEYFEIDPAIVRIIFVLITLVWGASIVIYLVLWISLPRANATETLALDEKELAEMEKEYHIKQRREQFRIIIGILLIIIGCLAFLEAMFDWFTFEHIFPIILILIGIAILTNSILSKENN